MVEGPMVDAALARSPKRVYTGPGALPLEVEGVGAVKRLAIVEDCAIHPGKLDLLVVPLSAESELPEGTSCVVLEIPRGFMFTNGVSSDVIEMPADAMRSLARMGVSRAEWFLDGQSGAVTLHELDCGGKTFDADDLHDVQILIANTACECLLSSSEVVLQLRRAHRAGDGDMTVAAENVGHEHGTTFTITHTIHQEESMYKDVETQTLPGEMIDIASQFPESSFLIECGNFPFNLPSITALNKQGAEIENPLGKAAIRSLGDGASRMADGFYDECETQGNVDASVKLQTANGKPQARIQLVDDLWVDVDDRWILKQGSSSLFPQLTINTPARDDAPRRFAYNR